ncbi:MAG: iron dependent repressor, metal binding and dimerization domain protein, partial [bacterium]|nr:iron dependent repressor, metal binding and dimerization domain protein [bacterium]
AMMITPAAAARLWTDRLSAMVWLSAIFGGISGVIGAYVSTLAPQMPTGPWMVIAVTALFIFSVVFAPERGATARLRHFFALRARTLEEHILKAFFHVGEQRGDRQSPVTLVQLGQARFFRGTTLPRGLRTLRRRGLVRFTDGGLQLTDSGRARAERIVRVHRLWEMYLSQYMDLPADHVHRDADQIEHVLTPELEAKLEALLDRPCVDPHGETIPYNSVAEGRP